ncbi:DeoR/GlpR family DNA-binding transcription regulator [Gymnodinialimonas sp. 2305UL16-5]|uniref:DeoR/GlpR family DNA-binding transcription regulator n=1 Tax=Gymnodinialimonas mytili TaxID=3126503 RepID=UPI0030B17AA6
MKNSFRQTEILEIARRVGKVTVEGLSEHFDVTVQTIRRDLTELDEAGHLNRVHGGAILASGTTNLAYDARRSHLADQKAAIARACAAAIPDDCSVFLNIGTSTEAVATELLRHKNILVITNNMNVANTLSSNPDCEVVVTGGSVRRSDGGLIGTMTVEAIRSFKFDYAVIGCSAIDEDGDVLDYDIQEVGVSQAIIAQARAPLLVADHSKLLRTAPARICSLANIQAVFTDQALPDQLQDACQRWSTQVHVAEIAGDPLSDLPGKLARTAGKL